MKNKLARNKRGFYPDAETPRRGTKAFENYMNSFDVDMLTDEEKEEHQEELEKINVSQSSLSIGGINFAVYRGRI